MKHQISQRGEGSMSLVLAEGGAGHALSEEEIEDIRESFDLFDTMRRGSLDMHAFMVALEAMGFPMSKEEGLAQVNAVLETSGATFNGRVDYNTFLEVVRLLTSRRNPVQHLMKAFDTFDVDSTGKISVQNVQAVA